MIIRKKLITDISAEHIRNVTETLKENHIAYDLRTKTNRSYGGRIADTQLGIHYGQSSNNDGNYMISIVYVRPRDYERARGLIT